MWTRMRRTRLLALVPQRSLLTWWWRRRGHRRVVYLPDPAPIAYLTGPIRLAVAGSPVMPPHGIAAAVKFMTRFKGPMSSRGIAAALTAAQYPVLNRVGRVAPMSLFPPLMRCVALVTLWAPAGMAGGPPPALRRYVLLLLGSAMLARLRTALAKWVNRGAALAIAVYCGLAVATLPLALLLPLRAGFPGNCRRHGCTYPIKGSAGAFPTSMPSSNPLAVEPPGVLRWTVLRTVRTTFSVQIVSRPTKFEGGLIVSCSRLGRLALPPLGEL